MHPSYGPSMDPPMVPLGPPSVSSRNGMAYRAKLAVYDYLQCPSDSDLTLAEDVYREYFLDAHEAGARVASNSWCVGVVHVHCI
jgi:hypothetical protein